MCAFSLEVLARLWLPRTKLSKLLLFFIFLLSGKGKTGLSEDQDGCALHDSDSIFLFCEKEKLDCQKIKMDVLCMALIPSSCSVERKNWVVWRSRWLCSAWLWSSKKSKNAFRVNGANHANLPKHLLSSKFDKDIRCSFVYLPGEYHSITCCFLQKKATSEISVKKLWWSCKRPVTNGKFKTAFIWKQPS